MGSNLAASSQSMIRCAVVANRSTVLRAWCTSRPGVLKIEKRSRFGRAVSNSAGSARRFSAVITLCEITANRSHAAFAPKYLHGITPPASSFFTTSCTPSTGPRLLPMPLDQAPRFPLLNVRHDRKVLHLAAILKQRLLLLPYPNRHVA